jgi:hypothetical protein
MASVRSRPAGARYPLELYVVCGNVAGLTSGLYRYNSAHHEHDRVLA